MQPEGNLFPSTASRSIHDAELQTSLNRLTTAVRGLRHAAFDPLDFEALRTECAAIRQRTLEHLDVHLEQFERRVLECGGRVHWCATRESARAAVLGICKSANAKVVTKGKSMIGEELGLNALLAEHGIEAVETDLGEYIVQLARERPSHLLAPAAHKSVEQIADLFAEHHREHGKSHTLDPESLVRQAREVLRTRYAAAEVGITGANFLVAETGSALIVTNEGNGELTQTLANVHVVVASIEKVVPTLEEAGTLTRMLTRSAAGQDLTAYTTLATGPRRAGDLDGPRGFHIVLYDGGRTAILGGPARDVLRCIRCAACINYCPVYRSIGGHPYGVYAGPLGAVLSPPLFGVASAHHLPSASTLCGRCDEVCPVKIPLRRIIHDHRAQAFRTAVTGTRERLAMRLWARLAAHPRAYRAVSRIATRALGWLADRPALAGRIPVVAAWTAGRELPRPEGATFHEQWRRLQRERGR